MALDPRCGTHFVRYGPRATWGTRLRVTLVAGARPNFVKIAPLTAALRQRPEAAEWFLVHTGQHYDDLMSLRFFEDLEIPEPDVNLAVGSASHAQQTARIMERFEPVLLDQRPDVVVVVGDVNSTLACALVAAKLGAEVAHVEAGLRSFDRSMPEELNRILTDHLSDFLFATEQSGVDNLRREGIPEEKVSLVGNLMVDALLANREKAERSDVLTQLSLDGSDHAVVTLHRPSNVDDKGVLGGIAAALVELSDEVKVVFPVHPRTRRRLENFGLMKRLQKAEHILLGEPLGYLDFLKLTSTAKLILTDSGGLQEEACILRVPCLTLRQNTERPATVAAGWNRLVGTDAQTIVREARRALGGGVAGLQVPLWDGKASERILNILLRRCRAGGSRP